MALDHTFAAAYIDNRARPGQRLLGVKVRPFCLWHLLLLQAIDSPLLKQDGSTESRPTISRFDLRTAIGICRLGYRQSRVRRPWWPILTKRKLKREIDRFYDYVGDYLSRPEYNVIPMELPAGSKPPRSVTAPPDTVIVAFEAAHGARISIGEAFEMPIGEAYIAQSMHLRIQGVQLDFMLDKERLFQAELKKAGIK